MPNRHPDALPLSRRTDHEAAFTAAEHEIRAQWHALVDARLIGTTAPTSAENRAAIAAMERTLGLRR
ncbi:hypothetical protein AB5I39_05235 [Sphingomonas sp. MMS24-J45]|uniref:hypothetical protein n=1 Tax=Sphingomonas sp. MMS24-J45 TaxID=3238806 RepID=UPI00384BBEFE